MTHVSSLVGAGGMRFLLTYDPEKPNTSYVQFLVDVEDYKLIAGLVDQVEGHLDAAHPDAMSYVRLFRLGPGGGGRIQAKFMGTDRNVLREAATQARDILREDGGAKGIRMDWRQRVKVVTPSIADEEANIAGITRPAIAETLRASFQGDQVGVYRERRRAAAHHRPPGGAGSERRGQHPEPAHLEPGRRPVHPASPGGVGFRDAASTTTSSTG